MEFQRPGALGSCEEVCTAPAFCLTSLHLGVPPPLPRTWCPPASPFPRAHRALPLQVAPPTCLSWTPSPRSKPTCQDACPLPSTFPDSEHFEVHLQDHALQWASVVLRNKDAEVREANGRSKHCTGGKGQSFLSFHHVLFLKGSFLETSACPTPSPSLLHASPCPLSLALSLPPIPMHPSFRLSSPMASHLGSPFSPLHPSPPPPTHPPSSLETHHSQTPWRAGSPAGAAGPGCLARGGGARMAAGKPDGADLQACVSRASLPASASPLSPLHFLRLSDESGMAWTWDVGLS